MSLNEPNVVALSPPREKNAMHTTIEHLSQFQSIYWGVWGKERYALDETTINEQHQAHHKTFLACIEYAPPRLVMALNYTFGLSDLSGYSAPITNDEFSMLSNLYEEAEQYARLQSEYTSVQFMIRELYCIRKTIELIPRFTEGKVVNETKKTTIHRTYVHLDFFKFSLINILIRIEPPHIYKFSSQELASHLVLSWFLGVGSFIEKAAALFTGKIFEGVREKCKIVQDKIEETPECPRYEFSFFYEEFQDLVLYIETGRTNDKTYDNTVASMRQLRMLERELCNAYYSSYYAILPQQDTIDDPLARLKKLSQDVKKSGQHTIDTDKQYLRNLRSVIDEKYAGEIERFKDALTIKDFFDLTSHPYFRALLHEAEILGELYCLENPDQPSAIRVQTILRELAPFFTCKYNANGVLFNPPNTQPDDLPRLVLAHHVHNANCDKLRDMMVINRLIHWPLEKQVLTISSSSSNIDIVKRERELCRDLGFNHYRIHGRQNLKAGNQNRAIFNAINCKGAEYYLTLDDDYFVFPDFPLIGHQEIQANELDYYQAPLAFKGVYKIGVSYGERTDAEIMHYFESTSGVNHPRTYVFPRGTGTIFSFQNGVSSIGDTGGFLVDHSSEDFGQGFLSLLQDHGLKGKKIHTRNMGMMSPYVLCIGEGVDLSGKLMQIIRWCHGTSKIYFHIFLPALLQAMLRGKFNIFLDKQVRRLIFFIPVGMSSKLLTIIILCIPFVHYIMLSLAVDIFFVLKNENALLIIANILLIIGSFIHYGLVQGRYSFSPLRIFLMDILITPSASYGYVRGMIGLKPKWWANKTGRVRWKQYAGPIGLFIVNTSIIPYAFQDGYPVTAYWALTNAIMFLAGFIYMNKKERYTERYKRIPVELFTRLFKITGFISVMTFLVYITVMTLKMRGPVQEFLFSILLIFIINMLVTFGITSIYILKKNKNNEKTL